MKKTLLSLILIPFQAALGQPVLNSSDIVYQIGDSFQVHNGNWMNPGLSGANQIWDFTGFAENAVNTLTYVDAATTSNGSIFPTSNVAAEVSVSGINLTYYYEVSTASLVNRGFNANGVDIYYSDGEDILRFPMSYLDQFTDDFYSEFFSGAPITRTGTIDVNVDGYGTVIMPDGTSVSDVLRVHAAEDYTDNATGYSSNTVTDLYFFYKAGSRYPIVNVATITSPQQTGSYTEYIDYVATGIGDRYEAILRVYPNPAVDRLYLNAPEDFESVDIYSNTGSMVLSVTTVSRSGMDVSSLSPGIYFLKATNRDNEVYRSKFVKQ